MKPSPARALLVTAALLAAAPAIVSAALLVRVRPDREAVPVGQSVRIQVLGRNTGTESLFVTFPSGYVADYSIDGAYVWSADKAFTQAPITMTLAPGEERVFLDVEHDIGAFALAPGRHRLTGKIVEYGSAESTFEITTQPPDLTLHAVVAPEAAPPGTPLDFSLTVTNTSGHVATFTTGGCVVLYRIHTARGDTYAPSVACPAVVREFTLDPRESLRFAPPEYGHLHFDPLEFPLPPGQHVAVVMLEGVAAAQVPFEVLAPEDSLAYLAGQAVRADGSFLGEGTATLTTNPGPPTRPPSGETHVVRLSHEGWFYFAGIRPGTYYLRVDVGEESLWYPWFEDADAAQPLHLLPYSYRDDLRLLFGGSEPSSFVIRGLVQEISFLPEGHPVEGALVMAAPARMDPTPDGTVGSLPGPGLVTRTAADGSFQLRVPAGDYRLVTGRAGTHRYQYWDHVSRFEEATLVGGPPADDAFHRFDLLHAEGVPPARITGTVLSDDPRLERPSVPLAGAEIAAFPILRDRTIDVRDYGYRTKTGEDGGYVLEVPGDTPYLVRAGAEGYQAEFYRSATRPEDAMWVDTAPEEETAGIQFSLVPVTPPVGTAAIEGIALRELPRDECRNDGCVAPAAGAVVIVTPAFPTFVYVEYRAVAGRDGRFRVDGLTADEEGALSYYVQVQFRGYEPALYPGGVPWERAEPLPVYAGCTADAGKILLRWPREEVPGFVSGWVQEAGGETPIAGALVRVYPQPENPHGRVFETRTDERGAFHVRGVSEGARVLVSAEAEGYVPAYHPAAHRWRDAELVTAGGPHSRVRPAIVTLSPAISGGRFIQSGRVRAATSKDPAPALETLSGRDLALAYHAQNLPGAFFYLEDPRLDAFPPIPVAGGSSGSNGAVIVTGLPAGAYSAVADRPGYEPSYYRDDAENPIWITLDASTPAVLADIELRPLGAPHDSSGETALLPPVRELMNVPNPFAAETRIRYELAEPAQVTLEVFDARGRLVRELLARAPQDAGSYEIPWDRTGASGDRVSAGVYFVSVRAGKGVMGQKVVILP